MSASKRAQRLKRLARARCQLALRTRLSTRKKLVWSTRLLFVCPMRSDMQKVRCPNLCLIRRTGTRSAAPEDHDSRPTWRRGRASRKEAKAANGRASAIGRQMKQSFGHRTFFISVRIGHTNRSLVDHPYAFRVNSRAFRASAGSVHERVAISRLVPLSTLGA